MYNLNKLGKSSRLIANKLSISKTTVRRILAEKNITSNRPKILTTREERLIVRKFTSGEAETTTHGVELAKSMANKKVSNSTNRNVLFKNDLKSYKKQKKPTISKSNFKKRKAFYQKFQDASFQDFNKIIFSDESRFQLLNTKGGKTY